MIEIGRKVKVRVQEGGVDASCSGVVVYANDRVFTIEDEGCNTAISAPYGGIKFAQPLD